MGTDIFFQEKGKIAILEHFQNSCPLKSKPTRPYTYGKFISLKEEHINGDEIKKYYADKTKKLTIIDSTIKLVHDSHKISIIYTYNYRCRRVGATFFRVEKSLRFISFNTKTKNFYFGEINRKNKKITSKKVRCNKFNTQYLTNIKLSVRRTFNYFSTKTQDWKDLISTESGLMKGDEISELLVKSFAHLIYNKLNITFDYGSSNLEAELFKVYLKTNGIAYPDAISNYVKITFPKKKLLKSKNIVHLFMDENNLQGKQIRKILNQGKNTNFNSLVEVYHNLGVDYFAKVRDSLFNRHLSTAHDLYYRDLKIDFTTFILNSSDKKRIIKLINSDESMSWTLIKDHLSMIEKLKVYGENIKMKFNNRDEFNREHFEISDLVSSYKGGKIKRVYNDEFISEVEEFIMGFDVDFYPKVLTTSTEYNEESQIQSNCVRTYVEKASSLIISLRIGNEYGHERITIEYLITKNKIDRIQTRGKYNQNVTQIWETPLEILDSRIDLLYKQKKFTLPKMIKEFNNGTTFETQAIFRNSNPKIISKLPVWDNHEQDFNIEIGNLPF